MPILKILISRSVIGKPLVDIASVESAEGIPRDTAEDIIREATKLAKFMEDTNAKSGEPGIKQANP